MRNISALTWFKKTYEHRNCSMYSISGNGMFLKLSVRWTYDLVTPAAFSHFAFERNSLKFLSLRRKPLFRYCYECGRSVGVRLTPCSRCHEVYFCSRACKLKSWDDRHKDECLRVRGKIRSSLRWIVMRRAWTTSVMRRASPGFEPIIPERGRIRARTPARRDTLPTFSQTSWLATQSESNRLKTWWWWFRS